MNKDYNKHLTVVVIVFTCLASILYACSHKDDANKQPIESNSDYVTCGVDSSYIEDSLHQEYDELKVDTQGNVYHVTCK